MRLKTIRQEKNIKQKELANAIGVSPSLVSKWEKGTRQLDLNTAHVIAKYLNITIDELIEAPKELGKYVNMDQINLFDFQAYKQSKPFIMDLVFIISLFSLALIHVSDPTYVLLYVVIFGILLMLRKVFLIFFTPKRYMKHLMQSIHMNHQYRLEKTFNTSYHYTQQILYTFSMFIFQILFTSFTYTIFAQYKDPFILTLIALWFILSVFLFGYVLILATVSAYPNVITYHLSSFRFRDPMYQLIQAVVTLQNTFFYVLILRFNTSHDLLRLTMVITIFLQILAIVLHDHNLEKAKAYQFDVK